MKCIYKSLTCQTASALTFSDWLRVYPSLNPGGEQEEKLGWSWKSFEMKHPDELWCHFFTWLRRKRAAIVKKAQQYHIQISWIRFTHWPKPEWCYCVKSTGTWRRRGLFVYLTQGFLSARVNSPKNWDHFVGSLSPPMTTSVDRWSRRYPGRWLLTTRGFIQRFFKTEWNDI